MPPTSVTSGIQAATQSGWQQLKVQQAQRNAAAAEQTARALEVQASAAQREADRAQEGARSLEVQSSQARDNAGRARQGLAVIESTSQMQVRLGTIADRTVQTQQAPEVTEKTAVPPSPAASTSPIVNVQGETTGRIINTTA